MRKLFILTLLILQTGQSWAQSPARTDDQVLKAISERMGVEIVSVEYFRSAPPENAVTAFNYLIGNSSYGENVGLTKQVGQTLAKNPAVERYITEKLAALPHDNNNGGERGKLLTPLGYIPAPWALRLLGLYLNDKRTMVTHGDTGDSPRALTNPHFAIIALQQTEFSDAPAEDKRNGLTPRVEKEWQSWWKANESHIEERIWEINPGYPRPVGAKQSLPEKVASTPKSLETPTPNSLLKKAPSAKDSWSLFIGVGVIFIVAATVVGTLLFRRKR